MERWGIGVRELRTALVCLGGWACTTTSPPPAAVHEPPERVAVVNPIQRENLEAGTRDWLITTVEPVAAKDDDDRYQRRRGIGRAWNARGYEEDLSAHDVRSAAHARVLVPEA